MIEIYKVVVTEDHGGGEYFSYTGAMFTCLGDAESYIETHCTLEGQEMQEKHGKKGNYPYNYLHHRNKNDHNQTWELQWDVVYESLSEIEDQEVNEEDE